MGKNKDWIEELKEVVPYILITDRAIGAKEFDTLVVFIEREIEKSFKDGRKRALEEVKEKLGGALVVVGTIEDRVYVEEVGVWFQEELDKLSTKENGRL